MWESDAGPKYDNYRCGHDLKIRRHGCLKCGFPKWGPTLGQIPKENKSSLGLYCGLYLCKNLVFRTVQKTPHFFYVRVKFWYQIIRNRLFIDMNYQWLCKYAEAWGQSFTVQDCPHMQECDNVTAQSVTVVQSCDCSASPHPCQSIPGDDTTSVENNKR